MYFLNYFLLTRWRVSFILIDYYLHIIYNVNLLSLNFCPDFIIFLAPPLPTPLFTKHTWRYLLFTFLYYFHEGMSWGYVFRGRILGLCGRGRLSLVLRETWLLFDVVDSWTWSWIKTCHNSYVQWSINPGILCLMGLWY